MTEAAVNSIPQFQKSQTFQERAKKLDTLTKGDSFETPDINDITRLFDFIEDETAIEPTP